MVVFQARTMFMRALKENTRNKNHRKLSKNMLYNEIWIDGGSIDLDFLTQYMY
jgi:hypothetical protein